MNNPPHFPLLSLISVHNQPNQVLTTLPFSFASQQILPNFLNLQYQTQGINLFQRASLQASAYLNAQLLLAQIQDLKKSIKTEEINLSSGNTSMMRDTEGIMEKLENSESEEEILKKEEITSPLASTSIQYQIKIFLEIFLEKFGKVGEGALFQEVERYFNSNMASQLFEALVDKYQSAAKCREDMIRFVLRKAITSIRDSFREQKNLTAKAASILLCRRYFGPQSAEFAKEKPYQNEEELMHFLLPYKKNSRNRTANTCFITEIFASEVFNEDYVKFLEKFSEIMQYEKKKKINKFIEFLVACVKENAIHKIKNFKRLPWLQMWIESTIVIAEELKEAKKWKEINKRPKAPRRKEVKA